MTETPLVSIVMSVYNGMPFLVDALESLLGQTYRHLEIIVIDDASTDGTAEMLVAVQDPRLVVVRNETNMGLTRSLNRALTRAQGSYVARMDADDSSCTERIARQVDYMEGRPEIVLLGTAYEQVDELRDRRTRVWPPVSDAAIRKALVSGNPFCHSSVMTRKSALDVAGPYDEAFRYSQDYELWSRLALVGELGNLGEVLLTRRYTANSVSNNPATELRRLWLFWQASGLAARRLGFAWYWRLAALRSIAIFVLIDALSAIRHISRKLVYRRREA